MKTFDIKTVEVEKMSVEEQTELLEYVLSLDPLEIYDYLFFLLNEKYELSEDNCVNKAYETLLSRKVLNPYRDSIMRIVDDELDGNKPENFTSKKDYLASNIAYLKQIIGLREGYEKEIKSLKIFETEYKTL